MSRVAFFSSRKYEIEAFESRLDPFPFSISWFDARLSPKTAALACGHQAICAFVNDDLGCEVLEQLAQAGVKGIALRSAGFNHVDLSAAARLGLKVTRVPAYSPHAVAEHAVALLMTLNRKIHRSFNRIREGNFSLEGLIGFDLHGKTAGIVGTGQIGTCAALIFQGFGCKVLAHDPTPNPELEKRGVQYASLETLLDQSDILSLHCPLNKNTYHMMDHEALKKMRSNAVLINTSRGALVDAKALIQILKAQKIGGVALDVYEEEDDLFFEDQSQSAIQDDVFVRLMTFPNVLITGHQAFLTREALQNIAEISLHNLQSILHEQTSNNEVQA